MVGAFHETQEHDSRDSCECDVLGGGSSFELVSKSLLSSLLSQCRSYTSFHRCSRDDLCTQGTPEASPFVLRYRMS